MDAESLAGSCCVARSGVFRFGAVSVGDAGFLVAGGAAGVAGVGAVVVVVVVVVGGVVGRIVIGVVVWVGAFGDEVVEDVEAEVVGCVVGALSAKPYLYSPK